MRFWKMSGAGNTFVLMAGIPAGLSGAKIARRLCPRTVLDADGLLSVSRRGATIRVDYWNADGSRAFCGNGTRCAASWALERRWLTRRGGRLSTIRGALDVRFLKGGRVEVAMPPVRIGAMAKILRLGKVSVTAHLIDSGVPHAVVFVPRVEAVDVRGLGARIRRHPSVGPAGSNVDFVERQRGILLLRTFERGVEDETLACGTGAVAAAAADAAQTKRRTPTTVLTRSGDRLRVRLGDNGAASLEGPVAVLFSGEISL